MATTTTNTTPARDIDLDGLIQSLPACKRCRDCRRGCDTLLPKCRQCTKANVECMFYDHGRNEFLPRSYIAELVDHVRRLSTRTQPSPAASGGTPQETVAPAPIKAESIVSEAPHQFEHHFAYAGESYRYLGAESCLLKSPRLQATSIQSPFEDDDDWQLVWSQTPAKNHELVEAYMQAVQPLYPILDSSLRFLSPELPSDLSDTELFSLNMMYSIACHVVPSTPRARNPRHLWNPSGRLSYHQGNALKYRSFAGTFYSRAMEYLEASTVDPTIETLRAVLLLAINSLFDPKSGNIGQQVALATRLALDLEAKLDLEPQEMEPNDAKVLRNMHSTIFSLENEIASTLDRPATFPEPTWELSFDKDHPADYLCSLYRLQHCFRKGDQPTKQCIKKRLPLLDEKAELLPTLRMALHQTHLLINPCWGSAWYVLEAVVSNGSIHTFLTPHWVYRAGTVLIQNMPSILGGNLIQLYSNALVVLELSSSKWPSSAALSASLADLMQHMKTKYRPEWENTLTNADVRI
ncbi:hypothetical protein BS50DRAFT_19803 [Corynespora cassiicola Philippines]|uniref:Zn(2)-C6 fungal-type domain-containing protein n=1 Tax=Corynespora cassiicola Philippines TaxID=1448308 RepID=A0A2T2PAD2_CORCC|nr:hypothetical protein BS50DRAFT_19803 [Corynespora cassiicola Philippines]